MGFFTDGYIIRRKSQSPLINGEGKEQDKHDLRVCSLRGKDNTTVVGPDVGTDGTDAHRRFACGRLAWTNRSCGCRRSADLFFSVKGHLDVRVGVLELHAIPCTVGERRNRRW